MTEIAQARELVALYKAAEVELQAAVRTEMALTLGEPLVRAAAVADVPEEDAGYRRHRNHMILAHTDVLKARAAVQAAKYQVQIALATLNVED